MKDYLYNVGDWVEPKDIGPVPWVRGVVKSRHTVRESGHIAEKKYELESPLGNVWVVWEDQIQPLGQSPFLTDKQDHTYDAPSEAQPFMRVTGGEPPVYSFGDKVKSLADWPTDEHFQIQINLSGQTSVEVLLEMVEKTLLPAMDEVYEFDVHGVEVSRQL